MVPDPEFGGGDGIVLLPVGTLADSARAVAIGPGGRIAMTGIVGLPGSQLGAGVAVLEADGTPEAAFGGGGTTVVSTTNDDRGEGVAMQGDGRVLVADSTGSGGGNGFTIVRLGLDGNPDSSFGGDGIVVTPIPGEGGAEEGRVSDVLVQPDGRIVAGGYGFDLVGMPSESVANSLSPGTGRTATRLELRKRRGRGLATAGAAAHTGARWRSPRMESWSSGDLT